MPFDPDRNPVNSTRAVRRNPHSKTTLSGGKTIAKLARGRSGAKLDGETRGHAAWNRATAPVQTMEGKLKKGQTGVTLDPKKKRKKKGRWSGFVYDLTRDRTRRGTPLVRIPRPSDVELYGGRTPAFRRIMAHKQARNTLRPY